MAFICCICHVHIQHNKRRYNNEKTIMNTTGGDQTDNVVDMNKVKLVITGENGFHMLYLSRWYIQHNNKRRYNNEKTIMNTTRGDQTDDVVDMNNVKLVIISDKGFMVPLFNTTKETPQQWKNSRKQTTCMQNVKQRRGYNQTWWINHVDGRHGEKIGLKYVNTAHHHNNIIDHRIIFIINRKKNNAVFI